MNHRIFVRKKNGFTAQADHLLTDLKTILEVPTLEILKIIDVYDFYKIDEKQLKNRHKNIFLDPIKDEIVEDKKIISWIETQPHFCIEPLPGQYDQRADSMETILRLCYPDAKTQVSTALLYLFNESLSKEDLQLIQNYLFSPIDMRLKEITKPISVLRFEDNRTPSSVRRYEDFIHMGGSKLLDFIRKMNLTLEMEDLVHIQNYFKNEKRNPTETEIRVLDTYWSDHCRHTTFETALTSFSFNESQFKIQLQSAYNDYVALRQETNRADKPETLMDMGTIFARYQRQTGELSDMEISDEVNACSVRVEVDIDGKKEPWLLMFKNETHNHPTEIEPFGGASTCVGGAIRDPLSGRAYVYQAMRITGAGDVLAPIEKTLEGKLPQRKISQCAAKGNSAYANQIGSSTTYVKEFYHPGFVAKRMEAGALVGAVPEELVVRKAPIPSDIVIMVGAKTGRDGVGGATGSSQVQTVDSIETAGSEVQKGSPVEERKIIRLFRKPDVIKMIKKSNDFGAGGVSVAIGELADGVEINLDVVPVKYAGLNGTELAISESQERMAVVVSMEDADQFIKAASDENLVAVKVGVITEEPRLVIWWQGERIVDLSRQFLDTNGIRKSATVEVVDNEKKSPLNDLIISRDDIGKTWESLMIGYNQASQKGLQSLFDFSLGRTTVLAPYGGKYQLTAAECSVQKIAVEKGETNTVSLLSHGYHPFIAEWSPFHGAALAIVEAVSRIVATGANWEKIRLSFQEYFERLDSNPEKFGKPVAALLGAIEAQKALNLPSIGGKDSMSGSFNDIHVPPSLIAFAVTTSTVDQIVSPEFKAAGEYIYLLPVTFIDRLAVNYKSVIKNFEIFQRIHKTFDITAASSIRDGGIAVTLANMSFGNRIGAAIEPITTKRFFRAQYGGFVITTKTPLPASNDYELIGMTLSDYRIEYQHQTILGMTLQNAFEDRFEPIFPTSSDFNVEDVSVANIDKPILRYEGDKNRVPVACVPVFPGTHSEYDMAKALEKAGAQANIISFRTYTTKALLASIDEMVDALDQAQMLILSSGFITTDEPAGSGSFIATFLENEKIRKAVTDLLSRGGLILGINSGFQALVKTGLLPFGEYRSQSDITFIMNKSGKFESQMVETKVVNNSSPWLSTIKKQSSFVQAYAALEGQCVLSESLKNILLENGQIVSQYVDFNHAPTMDSNFNPAGSALAIEGLISPNGQILGKMAHSERYETGLFLNIPGNKIEPIFESAVSYFKGL